MSPRVGNRQLAEFINNMLKNAFRVVHDRDIVPHVPPSFFNYQHHKIEVVIASKYFRFGMKRMERTSIFVPGIALTHFTISEGQITPNIFALTILVMELNCHSNKKY